MSARFLATASSCACFITLSAISSVADPAASPKPVRGTLEYAKTHALYAPPPGYPAEARLKRWTGAGVFELHVRADGTVADVQVLRSTGFAILDAEGISTFRKWRFYPGRFTRVTIPLRFTLGHR
jgi:periplasmic protein TonB